VRKVLVISVMTAAMWPLLLVQGVSTQAGPEAGKIEVARRAGPPKGPIPRFPNGTVNLGPGAQVEYASSTTGTWDAAAAAGNTVYGQAGSPIAGALTANRGKVVRFQYPVQSGDRLQLQYQIPSNGVWVDSEQSTQPVVNWPAVGFGAYISSATIGSTDVTVSFLQYGVPGPTYNSLAGATNWTPLNYNNWRLIKYTPSAPVGFGLVSSTDSGLLRAYGSMTMIRLHTGNGYGSTNTVIRRFTTIVVNTGAGITYADSATLGASFTCTEAGIYSFNYTDVFNAASNMGLSINSAQLTTDIVSITAANRLASATSSNANINTFAAITIQLAVGDVVRPHTGGVAESGLPAKVSFAVCRVA